LPADLYLFLGGHFVKYKNTDDNIDKAKYELFILQRVSFVFIRHEDNQAYNDWSNQYKQKEAEFLQKEMGVENKAAINAHLNVKEAFFDFLSKDITDENVKELADRTRVFVDKVKDQKLGDRFLAKLQLYGQGMADHCTNVANLSVFFAMSTGHDHQVALENIYLGALLHDYGKLKIDAKFFEKKGSLEYQQAMQRHPDLGKTALILDGGFNEEILRIIQEHHEHHDGSGYPKKMRGGRIYELTKIVSIANYFDNIVIELSGDIKTRQFKAIKELEKDQGHMFDPKILAKCLKALAAALS
jgi:putative nucleotidyltransferase with HDIG domain